MSSTIMSLFSVYFCLLLPLLSPFVSGAAIGTSLDKRALQCDASAVTLVKTQITHPYYFCTWYLDSANPRTRSPLPALDAAAIGQACKCVIASASAPVHLQSVTAVPTSATCQASDLTLVKTEYSDPKSFCTFFNAAPRPDSPVPGKSAQSLIKACNCYLSAKPSSTTSTSTTAAFCSSTAITGLKSNSAVQSFCNSFMRSTVSAVSTATSTSTVAVPPVASVSVKTATSVIKVTSTSLVGTTVTSTTLIPTTVVKTKTTTDITATTDVGKTLTTSAVETVYVADEADDDNIVGHEQKVAKRTLSVTSTIPVPSSWTSFAKAQLSSACGCVLPSATYSAFTTYTSTTTKVVGVTSTRSASSSTSTKTVTSSVVVSKFSTSLVVKPEPTTAATTNTTVTSQAESTISSDIFTTQTATTTITLNDAFCTSFLGYQPSTITVTSATTESTVLVYNATVTQTASPTTSSTATQTVTVTYVRMVKREPTPVSVAIKPTFIIPSLLTTSTTSSSSSSSTTATTTHLSMAEVSASCSALATGVVTVTISTTLSPTVFATETVTASPTTSSTSTTSTTSSAPTCTQSTVYSFNSEFIETCDYACTGGTEIDALDAADMTDCLEFCTVIFPGACHSVGLDTTGMVCHLFTGASSPANTPTEGYSYAYMPGG